MRYFERAVTEKETEDSGDYAEEFTRAFLEGEPTPGIQFEYDLHKQYMPGHQPRRGERAGPGVDDRPEPGHHGQPARRSRASPSPPRPSSPPSSKRSRARRSPPTRTRRPTRRSSPRSPSPARSSPGATIDAIGATEWTLSNGARVVLKPTAFKEDEILFRALSAGGISLAEDESLVPANTADQVVAAGGPGRVQRRQPREEAGRQGRPDPAVDRRARGGPFGQRLAQGRRDPLPAHPPDLHRAAARPGRLRRHQDPAQDLPREPHAEPGDRLLGHPADDDAEGPAPLPAHDGRRDPRDEPREVAGLLPRPVRRRERLHLLLRRQPGPGEDRAARLHVIWPRCLRSAARRPGRTGASPPPEGVVKKTVEKGVEPKSLTAIVFSGPFENNPGNRVTHPGRRPGARDAPAQAPAREAERDLRRPRLARLQQDPPGGIPDVDRPRHRSRPHRRDERGHLPRDQGAPEEGPDRQGGRGDPAGASPAISRRAAARTAGGCRRSPSATGSARTRPGSCACRSRSTS